MSHASKTAEKTAAAIHKWVLLSTPEEIERDGLKYILIRLLNMVTEINYTDQAEIMDTIALIRQYEEELIRLNSRAQALEDKIGI